MPLKIAAFPKCYIDQIAGTRTMTVFDWIKMARSLDADGLEKPVAYVVLQPGRAATEDELLEFCRQGMPSFKRPRRIVFVGAYPTTATGKIRRVELRAMAASVLLEVG